MMTLTTPQQNIWNLQKFYENTSISNVCGAIYFSENIDEKLLAQVINKELELRSGLRLQFCEENGKAVQYVSEYSPCDIPVTTFESKGEFKAYAQQFALMPFELVNSPMYRFEIFCVNGQSGVLVCLNHLVCVAWTFSLVAREVEHIYADMLGGAAIEYTEKSYVEYIETEEKYLYSEKYNKDSAYWNAKYAEKPESSPVKMITLPVAVPTAKRYTTTLSAEQTENIDRFCTENEISQAVLFEAALVTYLSRINSENKTITLGIPVLNRASIREKTTAGMFISTMPLTVAVSEDDTAALLCEKITDAYSEMFRHQKFPYSHILKNLRAKSDSTGNLYDVMISFQNAKTETAAATEWFSNGYSEVPFAMHIDNRDSTDRYTLTVDYQTEVFRQDSEIELIINRIILVLQQIVSDKTTLLKNISYLPDTEYRKVIFDFNDTAVDYPKDKCVHELFEEQAAKTPDKFALVFEDKEFTYRQLDEMSNSLAHYLRENGVKPNDVVPIISKRSWHIIVAMLGILKAGGAYMPVDPAYPDDRIEYMTETAKSKFALSFGYTGRLSIPLIDLKTIDFGSNIEAIDTDNSIEDLAVVLHTSGSTGKRKIVGLTHKNLCNFRNATSYLFNGIEQVISTTIITFDAFVQESIITLTQGVKMVLLDENTITNVQLLETAIEKYWHSFLFQTPTKLLNYINNSKTKEFLKHIDTFVLGGEKFPYELYELICTHNNNTFNVYGPTESSLWVLDKKMNVINMVNGCEPAESTIATSYKLINSPSDITIGKPLANTQIYILDSNRKPLPIGVAGELCISGDGVGKGYLNRPELTAEKFIPNPFIDGKIMYCTGDLARWREDGEIEYLGRIDTQVKIRGLRIELGEIESVISSFDGIHLTAVTDKRDENGRQYLVGYYTADTEIDEKALRLHLAAKLPKYMVPNYFVHLDEMPMTPSGKTDRKSLPLPQFNALTEEYVAPETEIETALCNLIAEILGIERVGVTDDFFDLGGDSLKAIEYVAKAHNNGVEITLQSIFDYPTVRELCGFLAHGAEKKAVYTEEEFDKYKCILDRNVIDSSFVPHKKSLGNVLLTGATGFLGAHILDNLMKNESGKIYCLVRGGEDKLRTTLKYYFGDVYDNEVGKRIIPVVGDIEKAGLSDGLTDDIQTVIHTAASVKHYGSYDYFHNVNVVGTRNVIECAKVSGAKLIHISTLSVSGNSLADEFDVYCSDDEKRFDETSFYIGQPLENVYIHSKFEAEKSVMDAMLDGLDAKIIRVGNLTNRESDYKFQPNYRENAFLSRIKAALELGLFPDYLMPLYAEFSPIDVTADGVVKIAQYADTQNVFHLNSNKPIYFDKLLEVLKELGIEMQTVSGEQFNTTLQQIAKNTNTEYIYEAFENDMDENGKLVYDSNIRIINNFTDWFMGKTGFAWKQTDFEYIKGYVEYFRNLGYFNR